MLEQKQEKGVWSWGYRDNCFELRLCHSTQYECGGKDRRLGAETENYLRKCTSRKVMFSEVWKLRNREFWRLKRQWGSRTLNWWKQIQINHISKGKGSINHLPLHMEGKLKGK